MPPAVEEVRVLATLQLVGVAWRIPGADVQRLEGAGHLFFWEQPDAFVRILREFLR